jgi:two-component system, sensor histidine kinase
MLPRIFDLFVQGDQSSRGSEGGLGIGLTLLRRWSGCTRTRRGAQRGPGRGSTFTVWLPLALGGGCRRGGGHAEGPRADGRARRGPGRRAADAAAAARGEGVRVFTAQDGGEGAALIERLQPDLALVDLGLPVMSGFELARQIRANPANARVRLVASAATVRTPTSRPPATPGSTST